MSRMAAKTTASQRPAIRVPKCPECASANVTIAILTDWDSYLQCKDCLHTWRVKTSSLLEAEAE